MGWRWRMGLWGVLAAMGAAAVGLPAGPTSAATPNPSVYVTNLLADTVSQYSVGPGGALSPKTPATVASSGPFAIAISPDGASVYVTNGNSTISQYNVGNDGALSPKTPATVATRLSPTGIAVSPDGSSVYVTNSDYNGGDAAGSISQYTVGPGGVLSPKTPATVATGVTPESIAVSPDGTSVYVTNISANTISQYNVGHDGALSPKAPPTVVTSSPFAIAVSPDGTSVYVGNRGLVPALSQYSVGPGGTLSPKTPASMAAGISPDGIAVRPDGTSVYVTNQGASLLSQYSVNPGGTLSPKTPATIGVPGSPVGIVVSADGANVYVADFNGPLSGPSRILQYSVGPGGALSPKSPATVATGNTPYAIAVSPPPLPPRSTTVPHRTGRPSTPSPQPKSVSRLAATGGDLRYLVLGQAMLLAALVGRRRLRHRSTIALHRD